MEEVILALKLVFFISRAVFACSRVRSFPASSCERAVRWALKWALEWRGEGGGKGGELTLVGGFSNGLVLLAGFSCFSCFAFFFAGVAPALSFDLTAPFLRPPCPEPYVGFEAASGRAGREAPPPRSGGLR